jgi:hypothetical protein
MVSNYTAVMNSVKHTCRESLPVKQRSSINDYAVPGRNEDAQGRHEAARDAFFTWVMVSKVQPGLEYMLTKNTSTQFKLAVKNICISCFIAGNIKTQ